MNSQLLEENNGKGQVEAFVAIEGGYFIKKKNK